MDCGVFAIAFARRKCGRDCPAGRNEEPPFQMSMEENFFSFSKVGGKGA